MDEKFELKPKKQRFGRIKRLIRTRLCAYLGHQPKKFKYRYDENGAHSMLTLCPRCGERC